MDQGNKGGRKLKKPAKYQVIYCPFQLRGRIESIGKQNGITGITPTLNHIVSDYERRKFGIQQQPNNNKKFKLKWL